MNERNVESEKTSLESHYPLFETCIEKRKARKSFLWVPSSEVVVGDE